VLREIAGSPFGLDGRVMFLALHPSGNFAYATFAGTDGLLGIAIHYTRLDYSADAKSGGS